VAEATTSRATCGTSITLESGPSRQPSSTGNLRRVSRARIAPSLRPKAMASDFTSWPFAYASRRVAVRRAPAVVGLGILLGPKGRLSRQLQTSISQPVGHPVDGGGDGQAGTVAVVQGCSDSGAVPENGKPEYGRYWPVTGKAEIAGRSDGSFEAGEAGGLCEEADLTSHRLSPQSSRARMSSSVSAPPKASALSSRTSAKSWALRALSAITFSSMVSRETSR
jgi:hypothetical protein